MTAHSLSLQWYNSVVGTSVYLLGGTNSESATKCLSGLYILDTGTMSDSNMLQPCGVLPLSLTSIIIHCTVYLQSVILELCHFIMCPCIIKYAYFFYMVWNAVFDNSTLCILFAHNTVGLETVMLLSILRLSSIPIPVHVHGTSIHSVHVLYSLIIQTF